MISPETLACWVVQQQGLQENHWLEWKTMVDLGQRGWQARVAKFVLGAANRPPTLAGTTHEGHAFMLLGLEPGAVVGTTVVDPSTVGAGLNRYLGTAGPSYQLDYIALRQKTIAVLTVLPVLNGLRPLLARGSYSGAKPVLQDGRIYVRRAGATEEATAAEVDDMLTERVSARIAAGPRWPLQPVDAWREGRKVHVQVEQGDQVIISGPDTYFNLMQMARERPDLPAEIPPAINTRITATFDPPRFLADSDPARAVDDTWAPLRELTVVVYQGLVDPQPLNKVIDMVQELAVAGRLEGGWVDVAYPLYYWPIEQGRHQFAMTPSAARTYVNLAADLATALLLAADNSPGVPS